MVKRLSITTLTVMLLLVGCRQGSVDSARLVELDSLIAVAPDSAAALLEAMPSDSLLDPESRAYHALLLTQARYKAYLPFGKGAVDTIDQAVRHYSNGHDPEKQTRSILYKGCVMEDLPQLDSAMYCYLEACQLAKDQRQHQLLAYIQFRIAQLYQYSYTEDGLAVRYYRESFELYHQMSDSLHMLYCLSELAALYRKTAPELVVQTAERSCRMANALQNETYYCANIETLAGFYLYEGHFEQAKNLALLALSSSAAAPATVVRGLNTACQALAKMGKADSAQILLDLIPVPVAVSDSIDWMRSRALVAYAKGDLGTYIVLDKMTNDKAGNELVTSLRHQLATTQAKYEIEQATLNHSKTKLRAITALSVLLLLLLIICLAFIYTNRKSARIKLEWEQAKTQLNTQLVSLSVRNDVNRLRIQTVTLALGTISYLGKKGSSSFKEDKDLIAVNLPDYFWSDADHLISIELTKLLSQMAERGESLKAEERKVLSMSYCGVPDVVIAKLMDYTNRQTVQNIKSRIATKLRPGGGSLADILNSLNQSAD